MARVYLSRMPKQHSIQTFTFRRLSGGLNLEEDETMMKPTETPELVNLWWENGVLRSRPGQSWASAEIPDSAAAEPEAESVPPVGYAVTEIPFHDATFFHIGDGLYILPAANALIDDDGLPYLRQLTDGVPRNAGTFFRFGDYLFYKNRGGFFRISHTVSDSADPFAVSNMTEDAFTPTILINADPDTGAGDMYQPENALSPKKRITFNASCKEKRFARLGNGSKRAFLLTTLTADEEAADYAAMTEGELARFQGAASVYIDGAYQEPALYEVNTLTGVVIFDAAPPAGSTITVTANLGVLTYHLPVSALDAVTEVARDGLPLIPASDGDPGDYSVDLEAGTVTFTEAPTVTEPPTGNTIAITYSKANPEVLDPILSCQYAAVYGSGVQLCMVLGGCEQQPNAIFWSGSTDKGMDPSYFPTTSNLYVGDTEDGVTGFGRQYDDLMVFKQHSIGKLQSKVETVNDRDTISLQYRRVNDSIGCDCPGSIRLVDNNLTFCSTEWGICRVRSASSAYENSVEVISRKVNGSLTRPGLLYDLRAAGKGEVSAHDDGRRYYLAVNHHVWLWDYSVSTWQDPSWFYWTDITPVAWCSRGGNTYHLSRTGRLTRLGDTLSDYGDAIRKVYQFPVQHFGSYDRLKDVTTAIISLSGESPTETNLIYETDYETRTDRCPLISAGRDRLTDRDLTERDLSVPRHAAVFRRQPMCRHVRHFSLRMENCRAGDDLAVLSVELQVRAQGKDR